VVEADVVVIVVVVVVVVVVVAAISTSQRLCVFGVFENLRLRLVVLLSCGLVVLWNQSAV